MSLLRDSTADLCAIAYKDGIERGRKEVKDIISKMNKDGLLNNAQYYRIIDNINAIKE